MLGVGVGVGVSPHLEAQTGISWTTQISRRLYLELYHHPLIEKGGAMFYGSIDELSMEVLAFAVSSIPVFARTALGLSWTGRECMIG